MGPQIERIQFEITPKLHVGDDKTADCCKIPIFTAPNLHTPLYDPHELRDDYTRAKTAFLHPSK